MQKEIAESALFLRVAQQRLVTAVHYGTVFAVRCCFPGAAAVHSAGAVDCYYCFSLLTSII